ncbi:mechanosensitive ion channel protein MscS [Lysobacter sp. TY2-98]|uniref:mechanosensitive ion channel family protein n=1 Tax=Lysobacter sp. TY2-98 TaxID=2290922 RepID=UPI000E1FCA39|nr:mechanosensitive ion channel domain-containing protein [Lysobacter sp. TY2-98]AXK72744.1 mechanosensitive ion channel protein MscS [Lysobacter sp. TY2-98]
MPHAQTARELHDASARVRDAAQDGWQGVQPFLDYELVRVAGLDLTVGDLASAIFLLVVFFAMSRLVGRALMRYGAREGGNAASVYTVSRVLRYALMFVGFLIALEVAGIPVSKFTVFAGAIGVGLGFGLQAIFNNFLSGLILLFDRSIKIGDFVELESGVHGVVRDIKIRATRISTNDNLNILVPNAEFVSGRVVNWTLLEASRRMRIPFGVAYGADKETVKKAAIEAACEVPFTLAHDGPRGPQVWLVEFGESRLEFQLIVWLNAEATRRPSAVKAAYNWALHTALQRYGIDIPFPQRDLHVRSLFGHEGVEAIAMLSGRVVPEDNEATPDAPLPTPRERAALAENDAQRDVEREIHEDPPVAPAGAGTSPENE